MKRNELEKMIRHTALADMPDVYAKIDFENAFVADARPRRIRRSPVLTLSFALKAAMVLILAAITGLFILDQLETDPPVVLALETEAEVYGFQMVSATSLLSQFADADIAYAFDGGHPTTQSPGPGGPSTTGPGTDTETTTVPATIAEALVTTQIAKITEYLNTMEVMLAEKEDTTYEVAASGVEGYQWTLTFTTVDLLGETLVYRIHYNETADPEDASRRIIDGVMTMGGNEYALHGTVATEGDTVRTAFVAERGNDSIRITDLTDETGQKYRYDVVKDGADYESLTMKLLREEDSLVATIDHVTETESSNFRFRRTEDGTGFEIRYRYDNGTDVETGRMDVVVDYDEETSSYVYRYGVEAETGPSMGHSDHSGGRTDKTGGAMHPRGLSTQDAL